MYNGRQNPSPIIVIKAPIIGICNLASAWPCEIRSRSFLAALGLPGPIGRSGAQRSARRGSWWLCLLSFWAPPRALGRGDRKFESEAVELKASQPGRGSSSIGHPGSITASMERKEAHHAWRASVQLKVLLLADSQVRLSRCKPAQPETAMPQKLPHK